MGLDLEQQEQSSKKDKKIIPTVYRVTSAGLATDTRVLYEQNINRFLNHFQIKDIEPLKEYSLQHCKQMIIDYVILLRDDYHKQFKSQQKPLSRDQTCTDTESSSSIDGKFVHLYSNDQIRAQNGAKNMRTNIIPELTETRFCHYCNIINCCSKETTKRETNLQTLPAYESHIMTNHRGLRFDPEPKDFRKVSMEFERIT